MGTYRGTTYVAKLSDYLALGKVGVKLYLIEIKLLFPARRVCYCSLGRLHLKLIYRVHICPFINKEPPPILNITSTAKSIESKTED